MACSSLRINFSSFFPAPRNSSSRVFSIRARGVTVRCGGLRKERRGTLWRSSDVPSREAINAVHWLKLSKPRLTDAADSIAAEKLGRLLKADVLNVFAELKRQNQVQLALLVYNYVRKEVWYEPDVALHCDMIQLLGKNEMIGMAEDIFFSELEKERVQPDTRAYTEMIGAYLRMGMTEKAMKMYEDMKASGCNPSKLTLTIMIRNLEKAGESHLAKAIKRDCVDYVDYPRKFIQEVEKELPRRRSIDLV